MTAADTLKVLLVLAAVSAVYGGLRVFQVKARPESELVRKLFHISGDAFGPSLPWLFEDLAPVLVLSATVAGAFVAMRLARQLRLPSRNSPMEHSARGLAVHLLHPGHLRRSSHPVLLEQLQHADAVVANLRDLQDRLGAVLHAEQQTHGRVRFGPPRGLVDRFIARLGETLASGSRVVAHTRVEAHLAALAGCARVPEYPRRVRARAAEQEAATVGQFPISCVVHLVRR
jgi:hypothetical protein